jgi:soluble lytic murein transglycosylase
VAAAAGSAEPPEERAGAALRAALETRAAGRLPEAAAAFEAAERRWPLIGDHAALLAIETRAAAGETEAAFAAAGRFSERYPDSLLRPRALRLAGDAAASLGLGAAAREAWRGALEGAREPADRAALQLALARSLEAAGDLTGARREYLSAWRSAPSSPEAAAAESALDSLEAAGRAPRRDALDWSGRGDALLEAGLHGEAVLAYETALSRAPAPALRERLARRRADALFRARRYPEARAAYEALGDDPEARFWRARATARSGDLPGAIAAFEGLAAGSSAFAPRARLLAATLLDDDEAQRERAAAHYAAVAESGADAELRRDALWRLGWLRYTTGRAGEAAAAFERLAGVTPDPIDALRARYFALRARERSGGASPAVAEGFAALARDFPLSYYGWRASLRSGAETPVRAATAAAPLGARTLPGEPLARIEILVEAGLAPEAEAEIDALAPAARSDADRIALAELAVAAGAPQHASALVGAGRAVELAGGPVAGREALWRLAWPRAFEADVAAAAAAEGVPAELVYAIMREESGFAPDALSAVGARGLLQLMPETAARMAGELGLPPPDVDALYQPALNIRLGTRLLGGLLRTFPERTSAAIGGYNAGSAVVGRWLEDGVGLAEDEWVEAIPYDETRAYVRRVLRSLHAYRVIY